MGVGRQIDRDVVPENRQIGAMVETVAAQIVLVRLAGARMLDDGEAGRGFEDFRVRCHRTGIEVRARDRHLARQLRYWRCTAGNIGSAGLVG